MMKRFFRLLILSLTLLATLTIPSTSFGSKGIETKTPPLQGDVFEAVSSWYGSEMGQFTADGHRFNPMAFTVAHRNLPFGSRLRLINPENARVLLVTVADRGPFVKKHGFYFRDLDVSEGCAMALGFKRKGVTKLIAEVLEYGQPKPRHGPQKIYPRIFHAYPSYGPAKDIIDTTRWSIWNKYAAKQFSEYHPLK